jgi:radical SAM superfamily enzyme YgiQ (UPF0313 family)
MHSDLYPSKLPYSLLALAYVAAYTANDWEITSYDEYVDLDKIDAVVLGEAEPIWPQVIADFESWNLQQVYEGGLDRSVEDIRLPRRDLIHQSYCCPSLITSKGCPFHCDYCYLSVYQKKKYRVLPVDTIIEDMEVVNRQNKPTG